jgi:hypothetical protein
LANRKTAARKTATRKPVPQEKSGATFVCIRRCFDHGRYWRPQREARTEKDYLLVVGDDVEVSEKNFMRVDEPPDKIEPNKPEAKALSQLGKEDVLA